MRVGKHRFFVLGTEALLLGSLTRAGFKVASTLEKADI